MCTLLHRDEAVQAQTGGVECDDIFDIQDETDVSTFQKANNLDTTGVFEETTTTRHAAGGPWCGLFAPTDKQRLALAA